LTRVREDPAPQALEPGAPVPISDIDPGERAERTLGDLDQLVACIAGEGLRQPVAITPGRKLILGARRLEACQRLGWEVIDAVTVTDIPQALERLRIDGEDACCVHPRTIPDTAALNVAVRSLQWWPQRKPGEAGDTDGRNSSRRELLAAAMGMNFRQLREITALWQAAHQGYHELNRRRITVSAADRARAEDLLRGIRELSEINSAYATWRDGIPPTVSPAAHGRRLPARDLARDIDTALGELRGLVGGLTSVHAGDITISPEVADQWQDAITDAIRALSGFRRKVRSSQCHQRLQQRLPARCRSHEASRWCALTTSSAMKGSTPGP
jgi:hypothetical protein